MEDILLEFDVRPRTFRDSLDRDGRRSAGTGGSGTGPVQEVGVEWLCGSRPREDTGTPET